MIELTTKINIHFSNLMFVCLPMPHTNIDELQSLRAANDLTTRLGGVLRS